ncbi:unnamed protein product, partial [Nesidiocoris tenuis]
MAVPRGRMRRVKRRRIIVKLSRDGWDVVLHQMGDGADVGHVWEKKAKICWKKEGAINHTRDYMVKYTHQ